MFKMNKDSINHAEKGREISGGLARISCPRQSQCCRYVTCAQKAAWACLFGAQFIEKFGVFDYSLVNRL
jgi:hypothetical protein